MAIPGVGALSPSQRMHLQALGLAPLRLRAAAAAAPDSHAPPDVRLQLSLRDGSTPDLSHPRLRAVLRVLDLVPRQVATTAPSALPSLRLPAPDELRTARAKRDLWPTLRRLRRILRDADADA